MKKTIDIWVEDGGNYLDYIGKMEKIGKYVYVLKSITHNQDSELTQLTYIEVKDYYRDKLFIKDKKILKNILSLIEKERCFTEEIKQMIKNAKKTYE